MPQEITIEELEAAMAAAVDEAGNDVRLADAVAHMTEEQRRASEENLRRWIEAARATPTLSALEWAQQPQKLRLPAESGRQMLSLAAAPAPPSSRLRAAAKRHRK